MWWHHQTSQTTYLIDEYIHSHIILTGSFSFHCMLLTFSLHSFDVRNKRSSSDTNTTNRKCSERFWFIHRLNLLRLLISDWLIVTRDTQGRWNRMKSCDITGEVTMFRELLQITYQKSSLTVLYSADLIFDFRDKTVSEQVQGETRRLNGSAMEIILSAIVFIYKPVKYLNIFHDNCANSICRGRPCDTIESSRTATE